jgi:hypothetical protein
MSETGREEQAFLKYLAKVLSIVTKRMPEMD